MTRFLQETLVLTMVRQRVEVINKLGLHARAAAKLVNLANTYESQITLRFDDREINGKSIMGIMMLAATQGSWIELGAEGEDAEDAVAAIIRLFANRCGEGE